MRYNLGRTRKEPPGGSHRKAYPFMLSHRWLAELPENARNVDEWVRKSDPVWYVPNEDVPNSGSASDGSIPETEEV